MLDFKPIIDRKLGMTDLGRTLKDLALATRSTKPPRSVSRIPPETVQQILTYTMQFPRHGKNKVSSALQQQGVCVSPGSIRGIWLKHRLETKELRLERWPQPDATMPVVDAEFATADSHLLIQDTYFVGYVKGIGRIYQQSCVDTRTHMGFAKLYQTRTALSAADLLNDMVLPTLDRLGYAVQEVMTDCGTEFCGAPESHPYELFLQINGIRHIRSRAGFTAAAEHIRAFHRFLHRGFHQVALKTTSYGSLAELQLELDHFLRTSCYAAPN